MSTDRRSAAEIARLTEKVSTMELRSAALLLNIASMLAHRTRRSAIRNH